MASAEGLDERDSSVPGSRPLCACTLEKRHMTGKARMQRATKACATLSDGRHTGNFSFPHAVCMSVCADILKSHEQNEECRARKEKNEGR